MTWADPAVGPPPTGGVVGVGCSECWAVAKGGGAGGPIPSYRDWLLVDGI